MSPPIDEIVQNQIGTIQTDIREIRTAIDDLRKSIIPHVTEHAKDIAALKVVTSNHNLSELQRKLNILWFSGKAGMWLIGILLSIILAMITV